MCAAKRGGFWLLVATPLLASSYLVLLASGAFDSKPVSYPDLEVQPVGPTFPILAALQASPEWNAWEATKETREEALSELRQLDASSPAAEIADKLRPEVARAIVLAEGLLEQPEMLGISPQQGLFWDDANGEAQSFRAVFTGLAASVYLTSSPAGPRQLDPKLSALALRLLAKSRVIGGQHIIGRLVWLTAEENSHKIVATDLHQAIHRRERERIQALLPLLGECRTAGDKFTANALKAEFKFMSKLLEYARDQLGNGRSIDASGDAEPWDKYFEQQWSSLRIQPNRCVALLAEKYRKLIKFTTMQSCARVWPEDISCWPSDFPESLQPNAEGAYYVAAGHSALKGTFNFEDICLARHQLLRLLIALTLYRMDHGDKLPTDLGALVPGYLPDMPCDTFTGEPPLYDPVAGTLAFRGTDFVASPDPVDGQVMEKFRLQGLPPGVAGVFEREGAHDPGFDLKAFFAAPATAVP